MNQTAIVLPFVGTMLLTIVVWSYMYARRIPFILRSNLTPQQLTPAEYESKKPEGLDVILFDRYQPKYLPDSGNFVYFGAVPPNTTRPSI